MAGSAKPGVWKYENNELVGTLPAKAITYLYHKSVHQDFEMSFQVKLIGVGCNSGIQFRSEIMDESQFAMTGPQCEIGATGKTGYGGVWWQSGQRNGVLRAVTPETYEKLIKPNDFNDMTLKCIGKRVTITLNGTITVDDECDIPPEGLLGWQIVSHGAKVEARFRNIQFKALTNAAPREAQIQPGRPPLAKAPFTTAQAKAHQQAWAKHLGIEVETPNSVGMKMVLIPPGEFMMGSTDEQVAEALKVADEIKAEDGAKSQIKLSERPQHRVVITQP